MASLLLEVGREWVLGKCDTRARVHTHTATMFTIKSLKVLYTRSHLDPYKFC